MNRQNVLEWLWFTACLGCGSNRIWETAGRFPTVSEAYEALHDPEIQKKYFTAAEIKNAAKNPDEKMEELISYCENRNIYIMTFDDENYPERLRSIYNPPAVMFCRGDLSCLKNDFCLSVVGTRKPSDYSVKLTNALVKELAVLGAGIISGFAVGIDITANLSAVRNGGKTAAVLGCGLDYDYPRDNIKYRGEIEENGLFISEYYPKASGTRYSFPTRNRILSGLSLGTIVIEAAVKSGALITANLALGQGRDIFAAAPHDLFDKRYGGNVSLIRDGAVCLCGIKDILYEYYENYGHKIASAAEEMLKTSETPKAPKAAEIKRGKKTAEDIPKAEEREIAEKPADIQQSSEIDLSEFTEDEVKIYSVLKEAGKPLLADELAEICGIDVSDVLTLLTDLEIGGAVSPAAGQSYTVN